MANGNASTATANGKATLEIKMLETRLWDAAWSIHGALDAPAQLPRPR